ncbi:MAG: hypothetical protein FWE27_03440 [Defluviitaleaceae bacterium]|nr:hypothetical protein [Defluviitaleaceae bacterium]
MLGTTLILVGLVGIAGKALHAYLKGTDPPEELEATVKKTRLDTKKADGVETYTYIITFFIPEKNRYLSLSVPQEQFDITMEKDNGILICNIKEQKFISWQALF